MSEVSPKTANPGFRWLRVVINFLLCVAILAAAIYSVILINQTEPTAEKINSVRKSAALVETIQVRQGTYAPRLIVLGTVQPAQRIRLGPRVSGQVTEVAPRFVPGGMIRKGERLLRIDPADFEKRVIDQQK